MSVRGDGRRTGVACNGLNVEVVVQREMLTSIEHNQDEIDETCSTHKGDKK